MPKEKQPKFPKTRTCTVGEMIRFASAMNGKTKQARKAAIIALCLKDIAQLNRVPNLQWSKRKTILRALASIDRVGVTDSLELVSPKQSSSRFSNGAVNEMKEVATALGLYCHKISGFVCLTRQPLTIKPKEARSLAEMAVDERGNSSPELPL